jgi:hypothetical protein
MKWFVVLLILKMEASISDESTNVEIAASTIFGKLQRFFFSIFTINISV